MFQVKYHCAPAGNVTYFKYCVAESERLPNRKSVNINIIIIIFWKKKKKSRIPKLYFSNRVPPGEKYASSKVRYGKIEAFFFGIILRSIRYVSSTFVVNYLSTLEILGLSIYN